MHEAGLLGRYRGLMTDESSRAGAPIWPVHGFSPAPVSARSTRIPTEQLGPEHTGRTITINGVTGALIGIALRSAVALRADGSTASVAAAARTAVIKTPQGHQQSVDLDPGDMVDIHP